MCTSFKKNRPLSIPRTILPTCIAAEVPNPRTDFLLIGKVQTGARWAEGVVDGIHGHGLAFLGGWRWHACAKFFILGKVWEDQE